MGSATYTPATPAVVTDAQAEAQAEAAEINGTAQKIEEVVNKPSGEVGSLPTIQEG